MSTRKQILVTGGAGFIGSHLCERLVFAGHDVLCVDNFSTGSKENISHLLDLANFEILRHDVSCALYVDVDEVYNLACPASPIHYQSDPVHTLKTSVLGSLHVLGIAKKCKAKILQASTSEVYGDPCMHPQKEDYWGNVNPVGFRSCYDEGKRCAETLFYDYKRRHNIRIKIIRIFNTYGPKMHLNDGRVVSNLVVQALKNEPLTIYGNGKQTRSFCHVDDLVDGMISMMNAPDSITGPINLGNPVEISIEGLAKKILDLTRSSSQISYKNLPEDDPRKRKPDISLAKKHLGWEPTIQLEAGLKKTIAYFENILCQTTKVD